MRLCERYTFDTFDVTDNNKMAFAAAFDITSRNSFSPLFIHGKTSTGKTHLLNAIGNKISDKEPQCKVEYIPTEEFVDVLIDGIRTGDKSKIKAFCDLDVMLIDDLQQISGKEATQDEFISVFNALYMAEKRIIITMDHYPEKNDGIHERLRSRLQWGLDVEIS